MNFNGAAQRFTLADVAKAAAYLSVDIPHVQAVMAVETGNSSFDGQGRPTALFEPSVFYRLTGGPIRTRAVQAKLAYERQGMMPYPDDSYPTIQRAVALDQEAALQSVSWGVAQLMGENYRLCGYATVLEMVQDAMASGGAQVQQFAHFVASRGLAYDLRTENWRGFALAYNGPGNVMEYARRLGLAYQKIVGVHPSAPTHPELVADESETTDELNQQELDHGPTTTVG